MKALFVLVIILFLVPVIATAQPACNTGADQSPCDGVVNVTELLDYIDLWYACSSCYPDLYDAIQAWYSTQPETPSCGDGLCNGNETCSSCEADCGACGPVQTTNQLEQFGITWTFDKEYQYGQFANGDYWVVGPVNIIQITPGWDGTRHGSMINPVPIPNSQQGYDSRMAGFNSSLLVQTNDSPVEIEVNSSLISSISFTDCNDSGVVHCIYGVPRPTLRSAAILTVLEDIPPENAFRPPYTGSNKKIYLTSDLHKEVLPNLDLVANVPNIQDIEDNFERPWLDHFAHHGDATQYTSPAENMPFYGPQYSIQTAQASLLLMLNETQLLNQQGSNKDELLMRFAQVGIDLYEVVENGGYWWSGGGLNHGRKWPIMFTGLILNHSGMKDIGTRSQTMPYLGFQEDCQTFYVDEEGVANGFYLQKDIGMPDWSRRHCYSNTAEDKSWDASYRQCCTAYSWSGISLSALLMKQKVNWNHNAFFDYVDRWVSVQNQTVSDPVEWRKDLYVYGGSFQRYMWDTYRNQYGCVWTRNNQSDIYSQGHYDCTGCLENCLSGPYCGDGSCDATAGETAQSCAYDCAEEPPEPTPENNHYYVRDGAAGTGDGSDWTNAYDDLPTQLERGATYYIADGAYGGYTFDDPENGTQYITIKKATVADYGTNDGWNPSTMGSGQAEFTRSGESVFLFITGNYIIDGQVGGGPGSWDSGHGIKLRSTELQKAIDLRGLGWYDVEVPDNFEFKHIEIEGRGLAGAGTNDDLFYNALNTTLLNVGAENVILENNYFHDAGRTIFLISHGLNWTVQYNSFKRSHSTPEIHGAGWADFGSDNMTIRYNIFSDIEGTAFLDIKKNWGDENYYWDVYGNVFMYSPGNPYNMGGVSHVFADTHETTAPSNHMLFYNNIIVNIHGGWNTGLRFTDPTGNKAYNNIWYNNSRLDGSANLYFVNVDYDYNLYSDSALRTVSPAGNDTVTSGDPFMDWENLNFSLNPATSSGQAAIDSGFDLGAPYDYDMFDVERGADGNWDRGAVEYIS